MDIVPGNVVEQTNAGGKEKFKEDDLNSMSVIVESIRDHHIPYIANLDTSNKMDDSLTNLYTIKNDGQAMSLKNELYDVMMMNDDTISSYFVRISQIKDQIALIGETIPENELVTTTLNGLPRA